MNAIAAATPSAPPLGPPAGEGMHRGISSAAHRLHLLLSPSEAQT